MRALTIRDSFAFQSSWQRQQKQQENQDQARDAARASVTRAFRPGRIAPGVSQSLENAFARLERCRDQDTDQTGTVMPQPLTRGTMALGVHESVEHLPQRPGSFEMSPEGRTDEKGRPLHYYDQELCGWLPIRYDD